jgi:D-alanyl-D-alanine carboxypeptidase
MELSMMSLALIALCSVSSTSCRISEKKALKLTHAHIETLVEEKKFSGVVLIAKNGIPIFTHVVGLANREKNIKNTIDTQFNLASMGKMFTGVAIAKLAQQGKLSFTDTIEKHIPDYPNKKAAQATIHQLLTHTAHVGDIFGPEFDEHQYEFKAPQDYINVYGKRELQAEPEGCVVYSNYGFVILGAIVERVSGKSFDEYVRDHIFNVVGMNNSAVYKHDYQSAECAIGYNENKPIHFTGIGSPAGGSYASAHDMLRFAQGLANHQLLNKESTELVMTGKVAAADYMYGYGLMDHKDADGVRWVGHGGGCIGMNTELRIYPNSGYTIVMLSNSNRWRPSIVSEFVGNLLPDVE